MSQIIETQLRTFTGRPAIPGGRELLFLGGSYLNTVFYYVRHYEYTLDLPPGWDVKLLGASELDFLLGCRGLENGTIDCQGNDHIAEACRRVYGRPYITPDPNRLIGLCVGSWHHVTDDPYWDDHIPADLAPCGGQGEIVSLNEVIDRVSPEIRLRLELVKSLMIADCDFFMISLPPTSAYYGQGARKMYLHSICNILYQTAINSLGLGCLDLAWTGIDHDGFLAPTMWGDFDDLHAHKDNYGRLIWPKIISFLNEHNWTFKS